MIWGLSLSAFLQLHNFQLLRLCIISASPLQKEVLLHTAWFHLFRHSNNLSAWLQFLIGASISLYSSWFLNIYIFSMLLLCAYLIWYKYMLILTKGRNTSLLLPATIFIIQRNNFYNTYLECDKPAALPTKIVSIYYII